MSSRSRAFPWFTRGGPGPKLFTDIPRPLKHLESSGRFSLWQDHWGNLYMLCMGGQPVVRCIAVVEHKRYSSWDVVRT